MTFVTIGDPGVFAFHYQAPEYVERGLIWGHFTCSLDGKTLGEPAEYVVLSGMLQIVGTAIKDRTNRRDKILYESPATDVFRYLHNLMWERPEGSFLDYPPPELWAAFWLFDSQCSRSVPRMAAIDSGRATRLIYSYDEGSTVEEAFAPSDTFYGVLTGFWHDINRRWA